MGIFQEFTEDETKFYIMQPGPLQIFTTKEFLW